MQDSPPEIEPVLPSANEVRDAPSPPLANAIAIPSAEAIPFRFTGTTGEFFGIWIVNLFLTIITVGIYSPWAKVRKKRYFYGHTWVADANFEYHGNPVAILKGRFIALAVFAMYSGFAHFMPQVAMVLALLLFAAAPWFIARSMAFNAFNSSYRNVRFRFHATYRDVLKAIGPMGIVLVISFFMPTIDPNQKTEPPVTFFIVFALQMLAFFLVYPYVVGALKRLHVNQAAYGSRSFNTTATIGDFYKVFFLTIGVLIVLLLGASVLGGIAGALIAMINKAAAAFAFVIGIMLVYFIVFPLMIGFSQARTANLVFNKTRLDSTISFSSTLKARTLALLYLTNLLAILFSMGLAIPWAVIRAARYRFECLTLHSSVPMEQFVSGVAANVSATGEALGEFFNIDLSL